MRRWHCFTLLWVFVISGAETVGSQTCLCIHPTAMHCFGGNTWKKSSLTQIYSRKREEHFSFLYLFSWLLRVLVAACELVLVACHTQVCCTQSPCSSLLLTRTSTGDTQTQFRLSLWGLWVLVCTRFAWALWEFLAYQSDLVQLQCPSTACKLKGGSHSVNMVARGPALWNVRAIPRNKKQ